MEDIMKHFGLWLDESGDFDKDDKNKKKNPSLVGGVLFEKGNIKDSVINEIIPEKAFHANEIKNKYAENVLPRINLLTEKKGVPVIFENKERMMIVDSTITYLNVLSEGIIHLIQLLAVEYQHFSLEVLIATRKDMENKKNDSLIDQEEYKQRLQERVFLGLAKRTITNFEMNDLNLKFADARKDKRLMIADLICNCWLTRTSKKFDDSQQQLLEKKYPEEFRFSLIEYSNEMSIKRMLADGEFAEAIIKLYTTNKYIDRIKTEKFILEQLKTLTDVNLNSHLKILSIKIGVLIKIEKEFRISKDILIQLQEQFLPKIRKSSEQFTAFAFDIALYLFTIYTHEGNILESEKQKIICEKEITNFDQTWESIDYWFKYKLRLAIHHNNCFDFNRAVKEMDSVIESLEDTKELFSVIDNLYILAKNLKNELLGKAYGNRLQSLTFLIRQNTNSYQKAISDSDKAILEFINVSDLSRQFQYRSKIECEKGEFQKALECLYLSVELKDAEFKTPDNLLEQIYQQKESYRCFHLMHYVRLMAQSAISKDDPFANTLYEALVKSKFDLDSFTPQNKEDHPFEVINWKLATFHAKNGNWEASEKYYQRACEICFFKENKLTLHAIGLAILAEQISLFPTDKKNREKVKKALRKLKKGYKTFCENDLPEPMKKLFEGMGTILDNVDFGKDEDRYRKKLWEISRKVCY